MLTLPEIHGRDQSHWWTSEASGRDFTAFVHSGTWYPSVAIGRNAQGRDIWKECGEYDADMDIVQLVALFEDAEADRVEREAYEREAAREEAA